MPADARTHGGPEARMVSLAVGRACVNIMAGMPVGLELRGRDGCNLGGVDGL
jgi:hypothetical protein